MPPRAHAARAAPRPPAKRAATNAAAARRRVTQAVNAGGALAPPPGAVILPAGVQQAGGAAVQILPAALPAPLPVAPLPAAPPAPLSAAPPAPLSAAPPALPNPGANYWTGSKTTNRQQLQRLFNAAVASKRDVGVYSSYYQWEDLFGLDFKLASNVTAAMPMWYAHYDKSPSCGDFKAFGGWAKPTLKQYNGDILGCNGVDHDISYLC